MSLKSLTSQKIRNLRVSLIILDKKPKVNVFEHLGDEQDWLQHATSWNRAFYEVFRNTQWLNGFVEINKLAV